MNRERIEQLCTQIISTTERILVVGTQNMLQIIGIQQSAKGILAELAKDPETTGGEVES